MRFLQSCKISREIRDISETDDIVETSIRSAEDGNVGGVLRGVVLPVYGGDLCGWICIGTRRRPTLRSTSDNLTIVEIAEHNEAQCALVMSLDGRFGVSWSDEFLPRYSHMTQMLEATSVWSGLHGWVFADIVRCKPEVVLRRLPELELITEASGEHVRWWVGTEYAVYAEPRLADPDVSPATVSVLTRTASQAESLGDLLRKSVIGKRPEYLLQKARAVGDHHPEVPTIWGELSIADGILDSMLSELQ